MQRDTGVSPWCRTRYGDKKSVLIDATVYIIDMRETSRVFMNGRSQAVRIPAEFRFKTEEIRVRRDAVTGDLILSEGPGSWQSIYAALDAVKFPEDFLATEGDRARGAAPGRDEL